MHATASAAKVSRFENMTESPWNSGFALTQAPCRDRPAVVVRNILYSKGYVIRADRQPLSLSQELSCWESNYHGDSGTNSAVREADATIRPCRAHPTSSWSAPGSWVAPSPTNWPGAAHPCKSSKSGRPAWGQPRRLPASSRRTSKAVPPLEFLNLLVRSLSLFDDFIARVEADSGITVPYRRTGTLQVAVTDDGMRELSERRGPARRTGRPLPSARRASGSGGRTTPQSGRGRRARRAVARFRGRWRADPRAGRRRQASWRAGDRKQPRPPDYAGRRRNLVVETDRGPLAGSAVVLAAGSWSGQIEIAGLRARRAGASHPRSASATGLERACASPRDMERSVLCGAVGRRYAARRRDDGGCRVRRANDRCRRARSD